MQKTSPPFLGNWYAFVGDLSWRKGRIFKPAFARLRLACLRLNVGRARIEVATLVVSPTVQGVHANVSRRYRTCAFRELSEAGWARRFSGSVDTRNLRGTFRHVVDDLIAVMRAAGVKVTSMRPTGQFDITTLTAARPKFSRPPRSGMHRDLILAAPYRAWKKYDGRGIDKPHWSNNGRQVISC